VSLSLKLPELDALACTSCGAGVEITALTDHAQCGHCDHTQALPDDFRARLSGYAEAVRQEIPRIVSALDDADLFTFQHAAETKTNIAVAGCGVLSLLVWCVAPIGVLVSDEQNTRDAFGLACFILPMLSIVVVAVMRLLTRESTRSKKRYRVQLPDVAARCSGCGGENTMPGGTATAVCQWCKCQLVASPPKIAAVLEAVNGYRQSAALRKFATQRYTQGPKANVPLAYRGNEAWYQKTTAGIYADAAWPPARSWLQGLAGSINGTCLEGDAMVRWLDEHFAGEHPPTAQPWSHPRAGVAFLEQGYPGLIELWRERHGTANAKVHIGVTLATTEPPSEAAAAAAPDLAQLGFELSATRGGFFALATPETTARLQEGGDPTASLTPVVQRLTAHARALELSAPPAPLPLPDPT